MKLTNISVTSAMFAIAIAASGSTGIAFADTPNVQTPSPVIFLADNLNEPDGLGWCIDTVGRGFADKLHAHSCKPQGGDVQFTYNKKAHSIESAEFNGKCMSVDTAQQPAEFELLDCDAESAEQRFTFDASNGFFKPLDSPNLCIGVGEQYRAAGPFSSRDLVLINCADAQAVYMSWTIR